MPAPLSRANTVMRSVIYRLKQGYLALATGPLLIWSSHFLWQETGLAVSCLVFTAFLIVLYLLRADPDEFGAKDLVTGLDSKDAFRARTDKILDLCREARLTTACLIVEIDSAREILEQHGQSVYDQILETLADRVLIALRSDDAVARLNDTCIAITLHPVKRMDLEMSLQVAARLQTSLEDPIALHASSLYTTASFGLCLLSRCGAQDAESLISATNLALEEARRAGPSAIRVYSSHMKRIKIGQQALTDEAETAFEREEVTAWYQPQLSTDTGLVTGIEVLARWNHPQRGLILPGDFLPALERAGLMTKLGETMLRQALETLRKLDTAGVHIPTIGVNFTAEDLRDPKIVDKISWQLDRLDLSASRLSIEVLETIVAASAEDMIVRNLENLAKLGCAIDLDDFGTGHASITSIRRFPISRLKIDRSFVIKCDTDPEQQRMLTAILTMAERLGLETLAEGVETVGEHALVSQLGVGHVQGFGIARPMPDELLADWVRAHHAKISNPPSIGGATA